MDKKNIRIIIISVGVVVVISLALFVFFRGPSESGEGATTQGEGFLSFLFPSSEDKPGEPYADPSDQSDTNDLPEGEYSTPGKLTQLTTKSVSGAIFNEELLKVLYFEKATGHLYEIDAFGQNREQRTITTIPKIFDISWSEDESKAVLRYLAEPEEGSIIEPMYTFITTSLTGEDSDTTEGIFLPLNTLDAVASPAEDEIFYFLEGETSAGVTSSFENQNQKEIFYSPFNEFLLNWPTKSTITLLTKPSASTEGYFYKLNPSTGSFNKILGGINGLTALYSPHGDKVLYSQSEGRGLTTKIYNTDDGASLTLNHKTLPEKCMFSSTNKDVLYCAVPTDIPSTYYPDDWYKGIVQFSDKLWEINLADGSTQIVLEGGDFDIINLFSNDTGEFLFFQNKKDGTLWSLKLSAD